MKLIPFLNFIIMKKNLFFVAMAAAAMTFGSCSKDADVSIEPTKAGTIEFSLSPNAGITRAGGGRDLYSQQALQKVTDMKVYAFKNNGTNYVYETVSILNTDGTTAANQPYFTVAWAEGTDSKTYVVKPKFADGTKYKFLAVGLDAGKDAYAALSLTENSTKIEDAVLAINGTAAAREAFAGISAETTINAATGTKVAIELKRVVAGVLGYFVNIPEKVDAVTVKKVAVKLYTTQSASVNLSTKAGSGEVTSSETLMSLEIPANATVTEGKYVFNQTLPNGVVAVANSLLGGAFTLPKAAPVSGANTLCVELQDAAGVMLKAWNVKIDTKQAVDSDDSRKLYSLLANNLYSIGKKVQDGTTDPGEGGGGDEDKPADLSKDQEIVITVNPDWDAMHGMELE
nr:MAG TPA: protein of unknown function (DUF5031) [Herelleviridae sp.]